MKLIASLVCILIESQSSTITTHNLTRSGVGLGVRMPHTDGQIIDFVLDARSSVEPFTLSGNDGHGVFSIGPFTRYANRVHDIMLSPPSDTYPHHRLIESLGDPTPYCFGGTIGIAEMSRPRIGSSRLDVGIDFTASVSLIPSQEGSGPLPTRISSPQEQYNLDLLADDDSVPHEIMEALLSEMERLGVTRTDLATIALLPSLEYTIYRSGSSSDVVVRIVLEPRDYFHPVFGEMIRPRLTRGQPRIGLNTLKHIGVFIDYRNRQIGFCEPI